MYRKTGICSRGTEGKNVLLRTDVFSLINDQEYNSDFSNLLMATNCSPHEKIVSMHRGLFSHGGHKRNLQRTIYCANILILHYSNFVPSVKTRWKSGFDVTTLWKPLWLLICLAGSRATPVGRRRSPSYYHFAPAFTSVICHSHPLAPLSVPRGAPPVTCRKSSLIFRCPI